MNFQQCPQTLQSQRYGCAVRRGVGGNCMRHSQDSSPGGSHALPLIAPPVAQPLARQWRASGLTRWIPSPQTTCPSPTETDQGTTHKPTMKPPPTRFAHPPRWHQPTKTPTFPHQHAEKPPHNQHALPILHVGTNQLKHRLSRTNTPKSHHTTNTLCPLTQH